MIKKRIPKQTRKRDVTSDEEDTCHPTKIIRKGKESNPHGTAATRDVTTSSTKSRVHNDNESNKLVHKYQASGTAQSLYTDTSTRQLDVDAFLDPQTPLSSLKEGDVLTSKDAAGSLYTGLSTYKHYVNAAPTTVTQSNASAIRAGPLKGQGNVRVTCRMDYQPDVCKDYKETGYCGYGDSCKFMHDRGDYKQGWQIDKEWELKQLQSKEDDNKWLINEEQEDRVEEEELPFACFICRGPFRDPVVTKCHHYFCELCAIKYHKKSPKCHACGKATGGVFLIAKELIVKLKQREEGMEQEAKEIRQRNEELGHVL